MSTESARGSIYGSLKARREKTAALPAIPHKAPKLVNYDNYNPHQFTVTTWIFLALPLVFFWDRFPPQSPFFPLPLTVFPWLSCFTRLRGNKNIITRSQASNCSHVFWTIMSAVLCLDPWKWPAVKNKLKEENVSREFYMHTCERTYQFNFWYFCVCVTEKNLQRVAEKEREAEWERAGKSSGI